MLKSRTLVLGVVLGAAVMGLLWMVWGGKAETSTTSVEREQQGSTDRVSATPRVRSVDAAAARWAPSGAAKSTVAGVPKRQVRATPPAKFATSQDERNWYERSLTQARELEQQLQKLGSAMVAAKPPAPADVLEQMHDDQQELGVWIRELEEKLLSMTR